MKDLAIFAAKVVAVLIVVKLLKPSLPALATIAVAETHDARCLYRGE